ncbi:MAG: hypothetical protein ACO1QR_09555 [Chthoniobacteraceae bacterium]
MPFTDLLKIDFEIDAGARLENLKAVAVDAVEKLRMMNANEFRLYDPVAPAPVVHSLVQEIRGARHVIGAARLARILRFGASQHFKMLHEAVPIVEQLLVNIEGELAAIESRRNVQIAMLSALFGCLSAVLGALSAVVALVALVIQYRNS